jgi:hypothetical protein
MIKKKNLILIAFLLFLNMETSQSQPLEATGNNTTNNFVGEGLSKILTYAQEEDPEKIYEPTKSLGQICKEHLSEKYTNFIIKLKATDLYPENFLLSYL